MWFQVSFSQKGQSIKESARAPSVPRRTLILEQSSTSLETHHTSGRNYHIVNTLTILLLANFSRRQQGYNSFFLCIPLLYISACIPYSVVNYHMRGILKQQKSNNSRKFHNGIPTVDFIFNNIGHNTHLLNSNLLS